MGIIAISYASGTFRTGLAEQRTMGVSADRIDRLSNPVASLRDRIVLAEGVTRFFDEIKKTKPLCNWFLNIAAFGLIYVAFSFLNSEGWVECLTVAVAVFFGRAIRRQTLHRRMNHFRVWTAYGGLAASIYILLVAPAQQSLSLEPIRQAGFISALLFLVPGFPLVTGIIDLVRHDFQGETACLIYVFVLLVSAGVMTWTVSTLLHWSMTPEYSCVLPLWLSYILRTLTSFAAAFGFTILFNSPPRIAVVAAMIGALIDTARLLLVNEAHIQVSAAVGLAALAMSLPATFAASKTRLFRVTLSVLTVVIMIPGVSLHRFLTYLSNDRMIKALITPFIAVFTIVGIGIGFAVARMLIDRNWLQEAPMAGVPTLELLR